MAVNSLLLAGSYAEATRPGIFLFDSNSEDGLDLLNKISGVENPSYLCVSHDSQFLYAVSEFTGGDQSKLTAWSILDPKDPQELGGVWYPGSGSCFVSVPASGKHIFVANYGSGSLVVISIGADGAPVAAVQLLQYSGHGADLERQEQPHVHAALLSHDQSKLFCSDLGTDSVYIYNYEPEAAEPLSPAVPAYFSLPAGSGPRHMACTTDGKWLYLLCELSGAIFVFDQAGNSEGWLQQATIMEVGDQRKPEAGDIQIDYKNEYVYASNRGEVNEIIVFKIDQETGALEFIQRVPSGSESPRSVVISPEGDVLLAANQQGNAITVMSISQSDGTLSQARVAATVSGVSCLKFIR